MNKKGFTLIELLGVIIILSLIMIIAIPNITSVLEKSKKENYITDAKKFIAQVKYEIRKGDIEKPSSNNIVKVNLSYVGTKDVNKDGDGNSYSLDDSYVVIVRNDGYLEYYVNLVTKNEKSNTYKGIELAKEEELSGDTKLAKVKNNIDTISDNQQIKIITNKSTDTDIINYPKQ